MHPTPVAVRLDRKVNYGGPIQPHMSTPCHIWTGAVNNQGYGIIGVENNRVALVHRVAWMLVNGAIPSETPCVLHRCDVPRCVNVKHLSLGTRADNSVDMARKGRSTKGDRNPARLHPERRALGERCGSSKLTVDKVLRIRAVHGGGTLSEREIAAMFGVCQQTINKVVRRRTWRHV